MKAFYIITVAIESLLFKMFPFLSYKGVINTQISLYNKLKKRAPEMSENDRLNYLLISRIGASPRAGSKKEEYAHYCTLLENPKKTLEDVIWTIVGYEFIQSRREKLLVRGQKMGLLTEEISTHMENLEIRIVRYIRKSIREKVKI